jgi:mRNA interferase MazF
VTQAKTFTRWRTESPLIQSDEIYLASFPFGDTAGMKLRPVLTLTGALAPVPEVLVAYVSSVIPNVLLPSDIVLDPTTAEHKSTNLKTKSALRLHKLATIHGSAIVRRIGSLSATTISEVDQKLRTLLGL